MTEAESHFEHTRAPLVAHLKELKRRLFISAAAFVVGMIISYLYAAQIYQFLLEPLTSAYGNTAGKRLIYTNLTEAFFTYLKLASFGGIVISFPVLAAQIYGFISPGLYKKEQTVILPYLVVAPLLFLAGAAMAYYMVMPMASKFFLSFETPGSAGGLPIQLEARISEYLDLMIHFILGFGIAFQLPVLLTLLVQMEIIEADFLRRKRRHAIVGIFIVAAVLTPPDVMSQILMALPLMFLYEVSVIVCKRIEKKRIAHA